MTGRSSDAAGEARLRRYLHQLERTCQFKYQIQSPTVVDQAQHEQDPTAGDGQAYKEDKKQRSALWACNKEHQQGMACRASQNSESSELPSRSPRQAGEPVAPSRGGSHAQVQTRASAERERERRERE